MAVLIIFTVLLVLADLLLVFTLCRAASMADNENL